MSTPLLALAVFLAVAAPAQDPVTVPSLRGRVVDATGAPIVAAAIDFVDIERLVTARVLTRPAARTNKAGRFRVPLGEGALYIAAKGRRARLVHLFDVSKAQDVGDIVLHPGGTLNGVLVDSDGKEVAGVHVLAKERLVPSGNRFARYTTSRTGARTNDRGVFQLPCAPSSAVELRAFVPGYAIASQFPVGAGSPLRIVLHKTGFVSGRVVDTEGRPHATEIWIGYEAGTTSQRVRSNGDGTFRLPVLHRGRYRIGAAGWGLRWLSEILDRPHGDVIVTPRAKRGSDGPIALAVRVVDAATEKPVRLFRAWFDWEYLLTFVDQLADMPDAEVAPDSKGVLRLAVPEVRKKKRGALFIVAKGHAARKVSIAEVEEGGEIVVRLYRERVLTGHVVDSRSGEPVVGAWVWSVQTRGMSRSGPPPKRAVKTGPKGAFRVNGLAPGRHVLQAYHPDRPVPAPVGFDVDASNPADIVVRMLRSHGLSAKIKGIPKGVGYTLTLRRKREPRSAYTFQPPGSLRPIAVPPSGQLDIKGLVPGQYTAELVRPAVTPGSGEIRVQLGRFVVADRDVAMSWRVDSTATGRLTGRLTILVPFPQLVVEARPVDASTRRSPTAVSTVDPAGRFEFEMKPGLFRVSVVDLASGFVLARSDTVVVEPDKTVQQDLSVSAVRLSIRLAPGGERSVVTHLTFRTGSKAKAEMRVPQGAETVEVFVPPGLIEIEAESRGLGRISTYGGSETVRLGKTTAKAEEGKRARCQVTLRGPPTIDEIEGRR